MKDFAQECLWLGDKFVSIAELDKAIEAYQLAGQKGLERLIEVGRWYEEVKHHPLTAIKLYEAAAAKAELISIGERLFARNAFQACLEAFIAADAKEQLVAVGVKLLEIYEGGDALRAFQAAGAVEKVIQLGKLAIADGTRNLYRHGNLVLALQAFKFVSKAPA